MNARERSKIETRRRLMAAGTALFADQGIAGTRSTALAGAAGVAVGTLYLHFKDKEGLVRAILMEGLEELLAQLYAVAGDAAMDVGGAVRLQTDIMISFAQKHPGLCRILFDPDAVRWHISTEIMDRMVAIQERRFLDQAAEGLLDGTMSPRVAARAVVGMLLFSLNWWVIHPDEADAETLAATLNRLRLSGVYAQ
ncbi:MAG: TetR/AcrR family transcriptional regulator [Candidatus Hydrogenedentes bacterium]|mgnify:CR=1 FL=1|nr:TetR/AcrR family transcriptional regulator [Candidatus Hydrogenedentota bacterium]